MLKSSVEGLADDGKGIVVRTRGGESRLGFDGRLSPKPQEPGLIVSDNVSAFVEPWPDLTQPPPPRPAADSLLEPLVVLMTERIALRVEATDLLLLDARTGKVIERKANYFRGHENCFPIRGGSPAFVGCNGKTEMTLFRIDGSAGRLTRTHKAPGQVGR